MASSMKRIRKSDKYKYVALYKTKDGKERWKAQILGYGYFYNTEKEAAKQVDLKLIEKGKKPVNILVRK
jgi:hypothetical protein